MSETLSRWEAQHPSRPKPAANTVRKLIERFERTGSVANDRETPNKVEKRIAHTRKIEAIREALASDPSLSIRRLAEDLNISRTSIHHILRNDLKMTGYSLTTSRSPDKDDQTKKTNKQKVENR